VAEKWIGRWMKKGFGKKEVVYGIMKHGVMDSQTYGPLYRFLTFFPFREFPIPCRRTGSQQSCFQVLLCNCSTPAYRLTIPAIMDLINDQKTLNSFGKK